MNNRHIVMIRGGGDLASGVALRLHRVGMRVVITELEQPLVIRRTVSFAEAVYSGTAQVEEVTARLVDSSDFLEETWERNEIAVIIDPECRLITGSAKSNLDFSVLVDGRMTKKPPYLESGTVPLMVGLGPGFVVGENCDVIVETNRGHYLGRVLWQGSALSDTGIPEGFGNQFHDRVLRAPADGIFYTERLIGERLNPGDLVGTVNGHEIKSAFKGVLRGLLHPGMYVTENFKIGDLDPRDDPKYCRFVSDKALAIAGGVLEAILYWDAHR